MPPKMAFATRSRFELLSEDWAEDGPDSEEEKEEEVVVEDAKKVEDVPEVTVQTAEKTESPTSNGSSPTDGPSTSTSTKKQLQRQRKKEAAASATPAPATFAPVTNGNGSASAPKPTEGLPPAVPASEPVQGLGVGPVPTSPSEVKKEESAPAAIQNGGPSTPSKSLEPPSEAGPSSGVPTSPRFRPHLTTPVPHPPHQSPNSTPASKKRPAPPDFAVSTPSPPPKGVKFQDGLSPGEGKEGERVIKGVGREGKGEGHHEVVPSQQIGNPMVIGGEQPVVKPKEKAAAEKKKPSNVVERTVWTFIMIFGFIALLCMGAPYMIVLVMVCQTLVYKEVTALFALYEHNGSAEVAPSQSGERGDKWNKTLNWYFFVVTNYFLYGESIIYYFKHIVFIDAFLLPFAKNHRFISFMLYIVGFVAFVANLQRQYLRQQFALFCWVHMTLLVIVVSSHFIVNNILEGMIWFFVPASLVICNDVMAYICGKMFGRTPLIKLSPKKTVEGFVGAFFCTLLFAVAWGTFFMRFNYMICPAHDLGVNVFSQVKCNPNPVFTWREVEWSPALETLVKSTFGCDLPTMHYAPYQLHLLVMASFASLVAPFGGFFASGFKRAFNIKDFGDSIPGHGGMTDRMDCQFLMGMFSYVYYSSLIRVHHVTVGSVLQTVVSSLTVDEQIEVLVDLVKYLEGQGVPLKKVLKGIR